MDGFIPALWSIWTELAPWLLLGAGVAGLLHGLLPPGFVQRQLSGTSGVVKAVLLGVPLPLCSCGVIPTGIGLREDGASNGAAVGFLTATPQTGVDSILVSASFLGWPFALTKVVAALVTGIAGGLLTERFGEPTPAPAGATVDLDASCAVARPGWRGMLDHGLELVQMIWGWLVVGVLISAALTTWLPADAFAGLSTAGGGALAFLVVLLASVPLYVCATASVPIAAALVATGMPTGAAMVFLMAGPATNVATLGAVWRAFGARTTAIYLTTIIAGSVGFGLGFEAVFGALDTSTVHAHAHHAAWWAQLSGVVLAGMVAWFAVQDAKSWLDRRRSEAMAQTETPRVVVGVEGMTCGGCSSRLERLLNKAEGVEGATVELEAKRATVIGAISADKVKEIVENAGFEAVPAA
jgi:uncharacterized membrane protein YraQ (UPF0718 family)/copper chaperone CopZ